MTHRRSVSFSDRQQFKKQQERKIQQASGLGVPRGRVQIETERKKLQIKTIGSGWFPKLTQEILLRFKSGNNIDTDLYSFRIDRSRTRNPKKIVWFDVYGFDMRTSKGGHFGHFCFDFEKTELRKD